MTRDEIRCEGIVLVAMPFEGIGLGGHLPRATTEVLLLHDADVLGVQRQILARVAAVDAHSSNDLGLRFGDVSLFGGHEGKVSAEGDHLQALLTCRRAQETVPSPLVSSALLRFIRGIASEPSSVVERG
jgi:hypothetical protein